MITESIKENVYALKILNDCMELTINKIGIDDKILSVDLNDLYNFPNLEKLSLCNMTIGEKDLLILASLKNLKSLKLYNCDFSKEDLFNIFNNLSIDELVLDNTEINFGLIKKNFIEVVVKNVKNIYDINCDKLDVSKAINVDLKKLKAKQYDKLIVSKTQYLHQKEFLDIDDKLLIKSDCYDEVGDLYE